MTLTNVGHGPCPCPWCALLRANPDASPSEKLAALTRCPTCFIEGPHPDLKTAHAHGAIR